MLALSYHADEHLHLSATSGTGHLIKHWHLEDDHSTTSGTVVEQQHHGSDGEIQIQFQTSKIFSIHPPALITSLLDTLSDKPRIEYFQADILPITHGPPRQPMPARAPPTPILSSS
jgi:hypothetical protein